MSSFSMDTRSKSSLPLVNSLVKNRLFKTAPDIDEPPFQFIHTMDLSVVDAMLHDSPDLIICRTEIWAVWRSQVEGKEVWNFLMQQFNCCTCAVCQCTFLLKQSHYQTLCVWLAAIWRNDVVKQSVRDITRISCFVTTMKLPHAWQIYSTVFVKKWCGFIFKVVQQQTIGKVGNVFVGR